jgi:cell division protein FtsI (penicillin-binding protein 3)
MDTLLAGVPGTAVVLRDRRGIRYESPARLNAFPVPGHDIYLTLDSYLQEIIEQALTDALEQYEADGGDMVVLDPVTGEILAIASGREGGSNALTGVFEPGSTAKLFAAAALLTHHLVDPTDSVSTEEGEYDLDGRIIHDDHVEDRWLDLSGVVRRSSNIGMVKLALRLTPDLQYEMLRDFGLGTPTGVEYPAESGGILKPPSQWSGTTAASLAMGYEVAVTALQLAQAYAAVANDGVMMQPTLIREVRSPEGEVVYRHTPQPVRRVVSPAVASELRSLLRGVVYPGGTGETAALTSYEVAGKTGTVRRAGPGGYIPGSYTACFVSMFPADDPQLVMVVKLDDPQGSYARLSAAPVTRRVLEQVLATRLGPLDRTRLTTSQVTAEPPVVAEQGTTTWVSSFPLVQVADSGGLEVVPDVIGLTLRAAARELHRIGFRVHAVGWGVVDSVAPAPGDSAALGSVVTVTAHERKPPR